MYYVSKEFKFCSAHQLSDAYTTLCHETIHGHNYKIAVELRGGELDKTGMVVDFGKISKMFKSYIDKTLDHSLMMPKKIFDRYPDYFKILRIHNERLLVTTENPTAENIAKMLYDKFSEILEETYGVEEVTICRIKVWETETSFAEYGDY